MAMEPVTVRQVVLDPPVDRAVTMTAQMFGLSPAAVVTLVLVALPLMAQLAEASPDLCTRMRAAMCMPLPEPVPDFYVRLALNPSLRQSVVDDYKATYGHLLDWAQREAAYHAGITDGHARDVLAVILPALNQALGRTTYLDDDRSFARQLKALST